MHDRPIVRGKFIYLRGEKLYIRGVTYGTFSPDANGDEGFDPSKVETDFAVMRANGINAVRIYTPPPTWLLDAAACHDLRVMIGLPWEQHVAFLDDAERAKSIERRVCEAVRRCAGHPAVLCYAVGNEIPSPIVRWHGRRKVERFIERLYRAAKREDPEGLVTYVNYPSTEYLQLPFVDFYCFNVYLETEERLAAYLARLQTIAGDRPLVMAEIGLDSRRNGEARQAETLAWQVRTVFAGGCAGSFLFAWTDEWWRGGHDVCDWDFGLTRRDRSPKPALRAVSRALAATPFSADGSLPRVSIVVCSYNGARFIRDCLEGLMRLEYPDYEVIVVDDGSIDGTAQIAAEYPVRLISMENQGLSGARNTGWRAATGEIVAYTDDDARPDPHWLRYLTATFMTTKHAGVGGPNIAPPGDGLIADCVANAPGSPVHVLLSDSEAEHIPGCNMAFRREVLEQVGGFDPRYRAAGDDVDFCWRVQQAGGTLGFNPAAFVWHHRRNSLRAYWKQQQGYGRAEALLEEKHPENYNGIGHLTWAGRIYGKGLTQHLPSARGRVYQGTWGFAPFQSLYQRTPSPLLTLPLMPEWYLVIALLGILSLLGVLWTPLLVVALPLLALAAGIVLAQACVSASQAHFTSHPRTTVARFRLYALTALLHLLQPIARLRGRMHLGLTPWRRRGMSSASSLRVKRQLTVWSETWRSTDEWLLGIEDRLRAKGGVVLRGGDFDAWDLELRGGVLGGARLRMMIEEHGAGKQLARFRIQAKSSPLGTMLAWVFAALALFASLDQSWGVAAATILIAATIALRMIYECLGAMASVGEDIGEESTKLETAAVMSNVLKKPASDYRPPEPVLNMEAPKVMTRTELVIRPEVAGHVVSRSTRGAYEEISDSVVPPLAVSSVGSSLFRTAVSHEALLNIDAPARRVRTETD